MKRHYGLVLKAHIAIATARFPKGTRGQDLDPFARRPLWEAGLDYDHGTGHGVGSYLSVHEGPQRLSRLGTVALKPGMILSNEPGYYREGKYGIRLENLVLVTPLEKIQDARDDGVRDADARPVRPPPDRSEAAAAVRTRLAQRLSRARQARDRAGPAQRRPGLAPPCHGADRLT
jgi:Xaa-Pro aminopeptidase